MANQYLQQLVEIYNASGNFLVPISDDPSGTATLKKITVYNLTSGITSSTVWGGITGTLSSQTDLQSALDAKANSSSLGTASTLNSGDFLQIYNNLSDISSPSTARSNLGLGTASTLNSGNFLQVYNNLADITNAAEARANLGLSGLALSSGNYLQVVNNLADLTNTTNARTNIGLGNVENTALSTWSGSTNINTIGQLNNLNVVNIVSGGLFYGDGSNLINLPSSSSNNFNNIIVSGNCGNSQSALMLSGICSFGGTSTTNFPYIFINNSGATLPTTWSSNGTVFGINAQQGFGGNFLDFHLNGGTSLFKIDNGGAITSASTLSCTWITATNVIQSAYSPSSLKSALLLYGNLYTGASSQPHFLIQPYGLPSANWNNSGTCIGVNLFTGFSGNFLDFRVSGTTLFNINASGTIYANSLTLSNNSTYSSLLKTNSSGVVVSAVSGTDYVSPTQTTAYSGQHYITPVALTSGTTVNWNMNTAPNAILNVPSGAFTMANPTNIQAGACGMLTITQPATTASLGVITWGSAYKFPGGTKFVLSTTANARDEISWYSPDGVNVDMTGLAGFA